MDIKKTTTTKLSLKKCHFTEEGKLVDEDGEIINVNDELYKYFAYASSFDLTASQKFDEDLA